MRSLLGRNITSDVLAFLSEECSLKFIFDSKNPHASCIYLDI